MAINLESLPEGCIANAISLTTPQDACRLSCVSRNFRSAAESDAVWKRFFPPDIDTILSQQSQQPPDHLLSPKSKKDLYLALSDNPVLLDHGHMSFSVDKRSGKKCYMISARKLMIAGDHTDEDAPEHWFWFNWPESRFAEVPEVDLIHWLEIRGKIDTCILSPATLYKAYLVYTYRDLWFLGFEGRPVQVSVGLLDGGEERVQRNVFLVPETKRKWRRGERAETHEEYPQYPNKRADGLWEVELGEFFCRGGGDIGKIIEMTCLEVTNVGKGGLIVEGIEVRPN